MTPAETNKNSPIANVRILAEQVVKQLKAFQIIANKMHIFLLSHLNGVLIVYSVLCNSKKSHYTTTKFIKL